MKTYMKYNSADDFGLTKTLSTTADAFDNAIGIVALDNKGSLYRKVAVFVSKDATQATFQDALHSDQGKGDLKESNR